MLPAEFEILEVEPIDGRPVVSIYAINGANMVFNGHYYNEPPLLTKVKADTDAYKTMVWSDLGGYFVLTDAGRDRKKAYTGAVLQPMRDSEFILAIKYLEIDKVRSDPHLKARVVNEFDAAGLSALDCALLTGNTEMVQIILEAGAPVNRRNLKQGKRTPIYSALKIDNYEALELLLKYGAEPNVSDPLYTPIMHARLGLGKWRPKIKLLLEHGCDPYFKAGNELSAMTVQDPKKGTEGYRKTILQEMEKLGIPEKDPT